MFRWIFISLIVGIVTFSIIFFGLPLFDSEADITARVNASLLDWSNRNFAVMPSLLADIIARSSLALIAATAGILALVAVILLMLAWWMLGGCAAWLLGLLKREPAEEAREDLPPIEMHSTFVSSGDGKEVIGRGMDRLDRD